MKMYQRILGVALSGILAIGLAACGSGGEEGGTTEDATAVLQAAEEKMQAVSSMESEMVTEMGMSMGEESMNLNTTMNMVIFAEPLKMKAEMIMDMGDGMSQSADMYIEEVDGKVMMYTGAFGNWMTTEMPADDMESYNTQDSLVLYLENVTGLKEAGAEQVNGEDATKYEGVISGDALEETLQASGTLDSLEPMLSGTDVNAEDLYKDVADIPVTVWISAEGYPVKYEMDMQAMMQSFMKNLGTLSGATEEELSALTIDVMKVSITSKNFNAVEDFEIPAEAKSGVVMPAA